MADAPDPHTLGISADFLMDPTTAAAIAILIAASSEIIALLPIRENSWVQLIVKVLKMLFPKR